MHFNSHQKNIHLDPAPDGAAGGAADTSGSPPVDAAPAFDAAAYVPRADFDAIQSDYQTFRQNSEARFRDYDARLPKQEKPEKKAEKEPDAEDGSYDFTKPGEFQRYQRELTQYHLKNQFAERETTQAQANQERSQREYVQGVQDSHYQRQDAYKAVHPDYDAYKEIAFGNRDVTLAVLESDSSAEIHHFLQKNPDKVNDIRKVATNNPREAIRMIGRLESQFEAKADLEKKVEKTVSIKPTKGSMGGGAATGKADKTIAQLREIYD